MLRLSSSIPCGTQTSAAPSVAFFPPEFLAGKWRDEMMFSACDIFMFTFTWGNSLLLGCGSAGKLFHFTRLLFWSH